jgi:hypothetical protein
LIAGLDVQDEITRQNVPQAVSSRYKEPSMILSSAVHRSWALATVCLIGMLATAVVAGDLGSTAKVTLASGPQAGKYTFQSADACMIAASETGKPAGFSVLMLAERSTLSVDIPNVSPQRLGEFQVELVVADAKSQASRQRTASTTHTVDTRPDASLEPYQRQERGKVGVTGRGTVKLSQQDTTARLEFQAETAQAVEFQGTIECRKVDREYGR